MRKRLNIFWYVAMLAFCGASFLKSSLYAQDDVKSRLDLLVEPYLEYDIVTGLTVGTFQQGSAIVIGYGNLSEETDRKPDGETVYEIGSVSKIFTGILLGDAVVRGVVELDQPAQELLSPQSMMTTGRPIQLVDIATHMSGLPRLPENLAMSNPNDPYADYTVKDLYQFLSGYQLERAPGEKMEYSNLGMGLLGHLLARKAGTSYEELLRERITVPLGMNDTSIDLSESQRARLAPPHMAGGAAASNWNLPSLAGTGGIRSTADDMLKFIAANLHPPKGELGEAIELAWKIHQQPISKEDFAMGLGWHIARDGPTRWHNGETGGYHAMMLVSRPLDTGVVVLANTATGEVDQLAEQIFQMLAGADVKPRKFEKSMEVDQQVMKRYVGKYELIPSFVLTVSIKDKRLMVGATGQETYQVFPRSETEWFYKVVEATLTFQVDDKGKCTAVELFQNGMRQMAKRIE